MTNPDSKSIRVTILGREYPLRVSPDDEAYTRSLAKSVDDRLSRMRNNIPTQPDLTHAVIGALEMASELHSLRQDVDDVRQRTIEEAMALTAQLDRVLAG